MRLNTGLDAGFSLAGWPGAAGTAANASPQGPATPAQQGFGVSVGGGGVSGHTIGVLSTGTVALGLLVWIWWALPR
jgi:hypothetical protein